MLAIANFGFFWERKHISQKLRTNQKWTLRGRASPSGKSIDFSRQTAIYVLYDSDRRPVYIGQTGTGEKRLLSRLRDHTRNHLRARWTYFSWFGFLTVNASAKTDLRENTADPKGRFVDALDEIESVLIQVLEPPLNKQGAKWKQSKEYLQVVNEDEVEISLEDVSQQVVELSKQLSRLTKK